MTKFIVTALAAALLAPMASQAVALDLLGSVRSVVGANVSDPDNNQAVRDEVEFQDTSREERE